MTHAKVMQSKSLINILFLVTILIEIAVLAAACSIPTNTPPSNKTLSESRKALAESVNSQAKPANPTSTTVPPETPTRIPQPDARSLLEKHCARCHLTQWIEQIEEPRTEWESILLQMERMGAELSETEKKLLLDYLNISDQP
jgi:hypothetical protein